MALMLAQPSMIKRPVLTHGDKLIIGFDPARYSAALKAWRCLKITIAAPYEGLEGRRGRFWLRGSIFRPIAMRLLCWARRA